jgi:iron complex transport system substrate-binding protein
MSACGGGSESSGGGGGSAARAEPSAFPVTIEHKYGSTTIERTPRRVVVVGLREQDALLALGVVPVATTEWYGKKPGAIFEWARDELGGAKPPVVLDDTNGVQLEKVAAQRPDLIIGVYSGLKKGEYERLSKLAPVVAQPRGEPDYGSSWQDETQMTGQAIGRPERARYLVARTEKLVADTAAQHPGFNGQTAATAADFQGVFVYGRYDVRTRMLEDLGFEFPAELATATGDGFGGQLSEEKVDLLDVGALLWFAEPPGARKIRPPAGLLRPRRAQGGPRRLHLREGPHLRRDVVRDGAEHADADGGAGPAARARRGRRPADLDRRGVSLPDPGRSAHPGRVIVHIGQCQARRSG